MEPSRNARAGAPAALGRALLLAALAGLTLLATAAPASALMAKPMLTVMGVGGIGVGIGVGIDPTDLHQPVTAQACIQPDSDWQPLPWFGPDPNGDGDTAVWVPRGTDSSSGSEKASTSCISSTDGPADNLPLGVKAS